jgi:hypothetical protein
MREMTGGDRTYYAPDEDTLLDPSFAETHCLRVVRDDKSHAGEIGIGFEPVRGDSRDTLVDINGVLWLDRASPRIQSLEYTYTGLEPDARGAGGELYFFTTPGGVAMVDHWKIHAPVLAYDAPSIADVVRRSPPPRPERRDVRVLAYTEMGGEVISARWPDGVLWHGSHPRIVGTINDQHGAPMPGQQVWITGSADTVTSRLDGRFEFPYMMRGVYLVQASDSGLARHGMTRTPPVAVRLDGPTDRVVNLVEYARDDVLALACPAKSYRPGTGVLLGVVINADSEPVAGAHIEVLEQPTADSLRATPRYVEGAGDGTFAVCGASLKWPMRVRAEKDGMTAEGNVADWSDDVVELTLVLRRKDD